MKIYINECQNCDSYTQISEILVEKIVKVEVARFSDFSSLKLNDLKDLEDYFHKKVEIGRKLKLCETILVQGLTDGLAPQYQNVLIVSSPNDATDWYKLVTQLVVNPTSNLNATRNTLSNAISFQQNARSFQPNGRTFQHHARPCQPRYDAPRNWVRTSN